MRRASWLSLLFGLGCSVGVVMGIEVHGDTWAFAVTAALLWGALLGLGGGVLAGLAGRSRVAALAAMALSALLIFWLSYWFYPVQVAVGAVERLLHAWLLT